MTIGRRTLLSGSLGVAGTLAAGATVWRSRIVRARPGAAGAALSASGGMCAGTSAAPSVYRATRPPLHPDALARFVDPLSIPAVRKPDGLRADPDDPRWQIAYYRIPMLEAEIRVHRDLRPTRVWSYGGEVPGPTIETSSGQGLLVEWANELPERHFLPIDHSLHGAHADLPEVRAVVHVHGAKSPPASDGYPDDWYTSGHAALHHYPNRQDAAMLWYHDHTMGLERLNQYAGLFGVFFVRDGVEEALNLPRGPYEMPLVLCDRLFDQDGQLRYPTSNAPDMPWVSEVQGDALLVNGKLFPYLDVEPRAYRFRLLNASNSRFYYLSLSNHRPFHQIGTDQGLLPAPVELTKLTLAPAERADVVIDFRPVAGENVLLQSQSFQLMQFRVAPGAGGKSDPLPPTLRPVPKTPPSSAKVTRTLTLDEYRDPTSRRMLMLLNGTYWKEPVTEKPEIDTVEIWSFVNLTEDTHPIHLHLVRFQILDRQQFDADEYMTSGKMIQLGKPVPPGPEEAGWKDTVRTEPATVTRIIVRFEGFEGRYVWHCHVLEHAANEMMRPFEVIPSRVGVAPGAIFR